MAARPRCTGLKQATLVLLGTVLVLLGLTAPANADPGFQAGERFTGTTVFAIWHYRTATSQIDAIVGGLDGTRVSTGFPVLHGPAGFLQVNVSNLDADGNVTGGVAYIGGTVAAQEGETVSQSVDPRLTSGRVDWSNVSVLICPYFPDGRLHDCTAGSADAHVTWTGQGPIRRGAHIVHEINFAGGLFNQQEVGAFRDATASGVVAGVTLPPEGNVPGQVDIGGPNVEGTITVCTIGPLCL